MNWPWVPRRRLDECAQFWREHYDRLSERLKTELHNNLQYLDRILELTRRAETDACITAVTVGLVPNRTDHLIAVQVGTSTAWLSFGEVEGLCSRLQAFERRKCFALRADGRREGDV